MKKILSLLLCILLIAISSLSLVSCGGDEEEESYVDPDLPTRELKVYNWGEYISDGFEGSYDTNKEFEKYFNKNLAEYYGYNIKVNYTTYATNEDMFSKISSLMGEDASGDGVYDIVIPSDYMIEKMIEAKMLLPFDAETISNFEYIDPQFKGMDHDPDNLYSVPYTYGMVGIIYNPYLMDKDDLDENMEIKDKSWDMLWNEKYAGQILQFNNPRDAFATAMFRENISINSDEREDWNKAAEALLQQKPLVQGYVNDEIFNKMTTGSATLAPYFAGDFITMYDSLPEDDKFLKFYYPEEGTNVFVDSMCILKSSKNVDAAKEYINFMLSRDAAVYNSIYIGYASPNTLVANTATGEYDEEYFDEMGEEAIEILYGSNPTEINKNYSHSPTYRMYVGDIEEHVYSLWESLKTENAIELWVHITSAVIIVSLLAVCISRIIIKKRRSLFYRIRDKKTN